MKGKKYKLFSQGPLRLNTTWICKNEHQKEKLLHNKGKENIQMKKQPTEWEKNIYAKHICYMYTHIYICAYVHNAYVLCIYILYISMFIFIYLCIYKEFLSKINTEFKQFNSKK